MEKLNMEIAKSLKRKISCIYDDAYILTEDYECAYCASEMDALELLLRKYRIATCVKVLQQFPLNIRLEDLTLPSIDTIFLYRDGREEFYGMESGEWMGYLENIINEYIEIGELYLERCLKETDWNIYFISELDEYAKFPKEMILHLQESIEVHWKSIDDRQIEKETVEYLTSIGLTNHGYEDFYPVYNLILTNEKITKVISICKHENCYKEWEEYKELSAVSRFYLLDRYFPGFCNKDICESNGICINYMIGEAYSDRAEESGLYQLNYEALPLLILADIFAELFLKRYEIEVGDES